MALSVGAISGYSGFNYGAYTESLGRAAGIGQAGSIADDNRAAMTVGQASSNKIERKPDGSVREIGPDGQEKDPDAKVGRKSSPANCETCKNRRYVDGSDESDVSFKTPGHISPGQSASKVMAHEQQHVANAYQKEADGMHKVISANVSLKHAVCPECGTSYVAGGLTRTLVSSKKPNPYDKIAKAIEAMNFKGSKINSGR